MVATGLKKSPVHDAVHEPSQYLAGLVASPEYAQGTKADLAVAAPAATTVGGVMLYFDLSDKAGDDKRAGLKPTGVFAGYRGSF